MIVAWDIPGVCDISAMTAAINTHVRSHDTYRNWFEFENDTIVRRTIDNPEVIDFVPVEFGNMNDEQIRTHALTTTPDTLEWGCFTFGIVQHADYFSVYASVDHLHIDGVSAFLIFFDLHHLYQRLRKRGQQPESTGLPQAGSYDDYTVRQRQEVASLTLSSPEIKDWIKFAQDADGDWPSFPLPLGDTWTHSKGDFMTADLLDAAQTQAFEDACRAAGARFSGGVLACAGLAEHALTGNQTYRGFTPCDTRIPGTDTMTVGWFASLFPVTVPIGSGSFPEAARAAQNSFNAGKRLAGVPFERVLELATPDQLGIKLPTKPAMMLSFLDFRKVPLGALCDETNFGIYGDNLSHGSINTWINRHAGKTTVTVSFPDNAVARKSVRHYISALQEAFTRAVQSNLEWVDAIAEHANSYELYAGN